MNIGYSQNNMKSYSEPKNIPQKSIELNQSSNVESKLSDYITDYQLYKLDYNELYKYVFSCKHVCEFKIRLQGKDYIFNIQRNDLRSKDYKSTINNEIVSNTTIKTRSNEEEVETFKGFANGKLDNIIRVSITPYDFNGYVYDQELDKFIFFQSVNSFLQSLGNKLDNIDFLVYDIKNLKSNTNLKSGCGVIHELINKDPKKSSIVPRAQLDYCDPIYVEIATDADVECYDKLGINTNHIIRGYINAMEGFYNRYFNIKFIITFQNIHTSYSSNLSSNTVGEELILKFRQYRNATWSNNIISDIRMLFSGKPTIEAAGIAFFGQAGDKYNQYGVSTVNYTYANSLKVLFHEVGHLLYAQHDPPGTEYIMTSGAYNFPHKLSVSSYNSIKSYLSKTAVEFKDTIGNYAEGAWIRTWNNFENNGWIGGWAGNSYDQKLVGDFDNDGDEEMMLVSNSSWSAIQEFSCTLMSSWYTRWHNGGNGYIGGWYMANGDKHIVGDFNGDGKTDLLSINDNKYWSALQTFNKNAGNWVGLWNNGGNHWISGWYIQNGDEYKTADFDGDGKDELLCISKTGGWAAMLDFENGSFSVKWHNSGSGWIGAAFINQYSQFVTGKFSRFSASDNQSLLIVGTGLFRSMLYWNKFTNSWYAEWSRYNVANPILSFPHNSMCFAVNLNQQVLPTISFSGNIDGDIRDELISVHKCKARTSEFVNGEFQHVWESKDYEVAFPKWDASKFDDYVAIKAVQGYPKQILAFKYQPTSSILGSFAPLVNASMYRSNGFQNKLEQVSKSDLENEEILLFPNPNEGKFNVLIKGEIDYESEKSIHIVDMNGREVYNHVFKTPNLNIDLSDKSKGIYLVEVKTRNRILKTKFIIK